MKRPFSVPTDEQLTFADHLARYYLREQSVPPVAGRGSRPSASS
jgi:hypothetical protein